MDTLNVAVNTIVSNATDFIYEKSETKSETTLRKNNEHKLVIGNLNGDHTSIKVELIKPDTREAVQNEGLLDSGATDCFIDRNFAKGNLLPVIRLDRAIPVYNVDGTMNSAGSVTHKTELVMRIKDHYEKVRLYITDLGKKEIIIGHSLRSITLTLTG